MPRYYRRRYTRVVRPKKKWASCIAIWKGFSLTNPFVSTLAANNVQSGTPTPGILKVGNFKVSADMMARFSENINTSLVATIYILFVPEGIEDAQVPNLPTQHPEYIMATKVSGGDIQQGAIFSLDTVNVSSRMKRNLNSGDRIVLFMDFSSTTAPQNVFLTGNVRYWCCSN